jgi:hypothetical protein
MTETKKAAIELVKQHFQSKIAGSLRKHTVPEWGIDVYYRPTTTLRQEANIVELSTSGKSVEALVESILQKALDENGKQIFSPYDKSVLMNEADPTVVLDLARVLNGTDLPTIEEAEKNS